MARTHSTLDGYKSECGMDVQWGKGVPLVIDNSYPTCKACIRSANRVSEKHWNHTTGVWDYKKPSAA
jgi:hypothetical protein